MFSTAWVLGFMVFTFPQTLDQAFIMLVPFLTLVMGVLYFLFPKRILNYCGVEAVEGKLHTIGEGRSSYAGILMACGAGCLFLQEPLALQPGLNLMLALAWFITGFGISLQVSIDGAANRHVVARMVVSLILALIAYLSADFLEIDFRLPSYFSDWVFFAVAVLTLVLGLISLLLPGLGLRILKLKPMEIAPFAKGETRGLLAGFYISLGATYLFFPQAQLFIGLVMAGAWLLTGIGRFVSILVDRGATLYNFAAVIFEIGIGSLLLGLVFGII